MLLNSGTNSPVLIITGMHRSGTSLTAAFLQKIGLDLGNNLLKGNYWNPPGYFEDSDFVEFQRTILQTCSLSDETGFPDWGWTESEQLDAQKLNINIEPAKQLVKSRSNHSELWGWKDPRTSLMLDFWNQIIPNARYLFVYRYPWDVTDSILRLNIPFFSQNPESCLKIWKLYNRHILEFYKRHDNQCLLVNLNTLLTSPGKVLELLKFKLNLPLKSPYNQEPDIKNTLMSVYNPQMLSSLPLNHPLIQVLNLTSGGCFEILNQLDLVADLPSPFSSLSLPRNGGSLERLSLRLHQETIKVQLNPESPQFLSWLSSCIDRYHSTSHESALTDLRQARQKLAEFWLSAPPYKLQSSYSGSAGKAQKMLLASGMRDEPLTDAEQREAEDLSQYVAKGFEAPEAIQYLLAAMLYRRADQLPLQYGRTAVPQWFFNDLLEFMLYFPSYFKEVGEVENYCSYMQQLVDLVHSRVFSNPDSEIWQNVALIFADTVNFVPLYFSTKNLKNVYTKRSDILEFILKARGHQIDFSFDKRPANRGKIRLGILKANFAPISETFTTIPAFDHLDREKFEIILYVLNASDRPLDIYCQSRADKLVKLPQELRSQVEMIRADDLDILFVGSIVTNAVQNIILLALHRLARLQTTYFASPVTTGIRNIDYYISGTLTEPLQEAQAQYRERLVMLDGTGFCFNYSIQKAEASIEFERKSLRISETAVVFISGANTFKIIPELRETWAKIIAAVPNSVLVLYPFGNTWSGDYVKQPFINKMSAIFDKYSIDRTRLILLNTLANREDVKAVLQLADVYLDSYPYAGANSTVDPLEVGLPTVVRDGNNLRSRQGAAILRDIQLFDLIADSEESYINLSVALGINAQLRKQKRDEIQYKMQQQPSFLDSRAYSAALGSVFEKMLIVNRL
ncbi:O-linked N-acetylglucosamine transferase family protein [Microcoleus sp. B7-D4]|uniref:O-linked N-acetylglucosamine transferase family protein n=1 Tax=Microcoleus sp. B7-D4 TaxID=2818696 RepID=UPI002FCFEC10